MSFGQGLGRFQKLDLWALNYASGKASWTRVSFLIRRLMGGHRSKLGLELCAVRPALFRCPGGEVIGASK